MENALAIQFSKLLLLIGWFSRKGGGRGVPEQNFKNGTFHWPSTFMQVPGIWMVRFLQGIPLRVTRLFNALFGQFIQTTKWTACKDQPFWWWPHMHRRKPHRNTTRGLIHLGFSENWTPNYTNQSVILRGSLSKQGMLGTSARASLTSTKEVELFCKADLRPVQGHTPFLGIELRHTLPFSSPHCDQLQPAFPKLFAAVVYSILFFWWGWGLFPALQSEALFTLLPHNVSTSYLFVIFASYCLLTKLSATLQDHTRLVRLHVL